MRRRTAIRTAVASAAIGLMVLGGAMPAVAAIETGDAVTRTKDVVVPTGETRRGKLMCPSGFRVTAGGVRWQPDGFRTGLAIVSQRQLSASVPIEDGRGWVVSGFNNDPATDDVVMRIVITCLPVAELGTLTVVTKTVTPTAFQGIKGTASCGSGKRVVSGGAGWFVEGQGYAPELSESHTLAGSSPRIDAKGWLGTGQGDASASLRVIALCRSSSSVGGYQTQSKVKLPELVNIAFLQALAGGEVSCPAGTRVVTGGAFFRVTGDGPALDGLLVSSAPKGKTGWYAAGAPANNGVDREIVLVVHCRPT